MSKIVKVIAEIGINHNGNIELAKKLIDVASVAEAINSGEDTKFMQTFLTNFITTKHNTNFNIYTKSQMINLPTNLAYSFIN